MSSALTERERQYLDCAVPLLTAPRAVAKVAGGFFLGLLQAAFSPGNNKGDQKLMTAVRQIRYTKYKKAVLRKQSGTVKKRDERLLRKLNQKPFALAADTDDADEFTRKLYEEYMKQHQGCHSEKS